MSGVSRTYIDVFSLCLATAERIFIVSLARVERTQLVCNTFSKCLEEQDKSSDIEQQPPFGDRKITNIQPQNRGGGLQNQQEHHIILTKYEAVHPTAVSENNSSSGMLII